MKWWCVYGEVEVCEQVWTNAQKSYLRPLSERLGLSCRGKSLRLQRVLTDFGIEHSFVRAVKSLREHYGFELGASAVRQATLAHAQRAREKLEQEYRQPFRALPARGPEYVIGQADGTMICTVQPGPRKGKRPREWKEMKLAAAQAQGQTQAVYAATFGSVDQAGSRWGHCARQAGWSLNTRMHVVADGAEWIRLLSQEVFGAQTTFLCDFYHVSEYLGKAALNCRKDQPASWRRTQQNRLKRGALEKVLKALGEHLEPLSTPEEQAPVRQADRYLRNRAAWLDYPGALAQGLPIGSGLIESGHRHVLQARLKKAGTAWLPVHADQMAHLRVLRANDQWEAFWN